MTIERGVAAFDLLLAYYGDDFTGSTDAMESLTQGGVETALFVRPPSEALLRKYAHVRAIGVAGGSRAMSTEQMEASLPEAFQALARLHPRIVHYKVCSTFDSSPQVGSIGRAIDIGGRVFRNRVIPLVVGVPALGRYCVFGNLFARADADGPVYRLDRHPTMCQHPVTPMSEADVRAVLAKQTSRPSTLVDVLALDRPEGLTVERLAQAAAEDGSILLFDTLTEEHSRTIGRLIWELQRDERKPLFVVGSSGVEYALTMHWQDAGVVPAARDGGRKSSLLPAAEPVEQTIVVSGSCSPVTDRQIGWALANGFAEAPLDTAQLLNESRLDEAVARIVERVVSEFRAGRSVIVHTCRGPRDPRIAKLAQTRGNDGAASRRLGEILGRILRDVLRVCRMHRLAVAGGDTSGEVARALNIDVLEMAAPLSPGAPICTARSADPNIDGIEMVFKGGQVGPDDFFGALLRGQP